MEISHTRCIFKIMFFFCETNQSRPLWRRSSQSCRGSCHSLTVCPLSRHWLLSAASPHHRRVSFTSCHFFHTCRQPTFLIPAIHLLSSVSLLIRWHTFTSTPPQQNASPAFVIQGDLQPHRPFVKSRRQPPPFIPQEVVQAGWMWQAARDTLLYQLRLTSAQAQCGNLAVIRKRHIRSKRRESSEEWSASSNTDWFIHCRGRCDLTVKTLTRHFIW